VREKIAQMTVDCFAAESAVWMVGALHRQRLAMTTRRSARSPRCLPVRRCSGQPTRACRSPGGSGYMRELPYEQYSRDARIRAHLRGHQRNPAALHRAVFAERCRCVAVGLAVCSELIFNDPIKGFGVLSGYAERRFTRATGLVPAVSARRLRHRCVVG